MGNDFDGTLVTLEGIDGSGKTTVWESLKEVFPDAKFTREPTETWYGDAVYESLETPDADPLAELFLYTADSAAHHADVLCPELRDGGVVISDRYYDSRVAYQTATLEEYDRIDEPFEFVQKIHQPWAIEPDITVYLDVTPRVGFERSAAANKFEQEEYLNRVATVYELLVDTHPHRFMWVDGEQTRDAVLDETVEAINRTVSVTHD